MREDFPVEILLFLLYVNDICNISDILFPILFADDTNVFVSGREMTFVIFLIFYSQYCLLMTPMFC